MHSSEKGVPGRIAPCKAVGVDTAMTDRYESNTHTDGSPCPEGTQCLPEDGRICCNAFAARTMACYFDIRYEYWQNLGGWFVVIQPDAGGGGVAINYCPHCGARLQGEARTGRYYDLGDFEVEH